MCRSKKRMRLAVGLYVFCLTWLAIMGHNRLRSMFDVPPLRRTFGTTPHPARDPNSHPPSFPLPPILNVVCVIPAVNRQPDFLHRTLAQFATVCSTLRVYDADASAPYAFESEVRSFANAVFTKVPMQGVYRYLDRAFDPNEKHRIPPRFASSMGKDDASFVTWRTREGYAMLYALNHTLSHSPTATHVAWFQDDMTLTVNDVSWSEILRGNVTCLRTGKQYCGATAYAFSRHFAVALLPVLKRYIHVLPVDWIIDMMSVSDTRRRGIAAHLGKVSTNSRRRDTDG